MKTWDERMDALMDWCEMKMTKMPTEKGLEAAGLLLEALKVQPERSDRRGTPDSMPRDDRPMRTIV